MKGKLSASFAAVDREYELNKAERKFIVPSIGKYNAKFKLIEERVRGISYNQTIRKTESKRKEAEKITNSIPIWDRVIRALNSYKNEYQNNIRTSNKNDDIEYKEDIKLSEDSPKITKNYSTDIVGHNKSMTAKSRLSEINKNSPQKHHKSNTTVLRKDGSSTHHKPYHLYITDTGRFIDTTSIPSKLESHRRNILFEKQTRKQYISPRYEVSEIKHTNPEFNKLDIKDHRKISSFDMSKGETRDQFMEKFRLKIPGLAPITTAEYESTSNKVEPPK